MAALMTLNDITCVITHEVMKDPVMCVDGNTYERSAIEELFENYNTSPLTGATLSSTNVTPNQTLRRAIIQYQEQVDPEPSAPSSLIKTIGQEQENEEPVPVPSAPPALTTTPRSRYHVTNRRVKVSVIGLHSSRSSTVPLCIASCTIDRVSRMASNV